MEESLSLTDAAKFLGVSDTTLRNRVNHGTLAARKRNNEWHIKLAELEKHYPIYTADRKWLVSMRARQIDNGWSVHASAIRRSDDVLDITTFSPDFRGKTQLEALYSAALSISKSWKIDLHVLGVKEPNGQSTR